MKQKKKEEEIQSRRTNSKYTSDHNKCQQSKHTSQNKNFQIRINNKISLYIYFFQNTTLNILDIIMKN